MKRFFYFAIVFIPLLCLLAITLYTRGNKFKEQYEKELIKKYINKLNNKNQINSDMQIFQKNMEDEISNIKTQLKNQIPSIE